MPLFAYFRSKEIIKRNIKKIFVIAALLAGAMAYAVETATPKYEMKKYEPALKGGHNHAAHPAKRPMAQRDSAAIAARRDSMMAARKQAKVYTPGDTLSVLPASFKTIHVGDKEFYLAGQSKFKAIVNGDTLRFVVMH